MLSDSVEEGLGDSDLQEGTEKVAMVHLASELSSVVGLETVEVVKNAERTADLVTVPCGFAGCGETRREGFSSLWVWFQVAAEDLRSLH